MNTPIIGVTPSAGLNSVGVRAYSIGADYTQAIERAGGIPIILVPHSPNIDALLDMLSGIVFSGGGDMDPSIFHQERHEKTGFIDDERDAFEMALMKEAFARDIPILAICRGVQVMNVERGGTLIQDIPSQTDNASKHAQREMGAGEYEMFQTATMVAGDNPLTRALGDGDVNINSFHHQALGDIAPSLEVVAKSDDGIVEAVYAPGQSYAVGTQWHPERLAAEHSEHQLLFDHLVEAATAYANRKA